MQANEKVMIDLGFNGTNIISLILLLCIGGSDRFVGCYEGPRGVRFTYSPSFTSLYEGQEFKFTCWAGTGEGTGYENAMPSNKPEIITLVYFRDAGRIEAKKLLGCEYTGTEAKVIEDLSHDVQWKPLTTDDCGDRDNKLDKITITGNITKFMQAKYSNFSCEAYYKVNGSDLIEASKDHLNRIPNLQAPQNLTFTLSNVIVEEGKRFNFSCISVGAIPSSSYIYNVRRNTDTVPTDVNDTFYVPNRQDREGINITCIDKSHSNFPGSKTNIIKWIYVMPQYVEFKDSVGKEPVKTVVLDRHTPPSINLSCDVFVSSEGLGHAWSFNGLDLKEWDNKLQINLITSDLKNDDKADCKVGFADGQTSKQYSWIFRRTESKQLPWLPIVLGSVAAVVLIVAVSLVLCCKQKPQARSAPRNTVASRGNPLATNRQRTQRGETRTGLKAITTADPSHFQSQNQTPTMMYPSDPTNTLLQQQYNHNQQLRQMEDQRLNLNSREQPEGQERVFVFHTDEV